MRRLTLILSDLYLPEEAARGASFPAALELPNLDWLMRFAQRVEHIADWRAWLSAELAAYDLARTSVATCCALRSLPPRAAANAWFATPVHLEARMDHVRLADRGLLRLGAEERASWRREFALAFGPEYELHDAGDRGFLLSGAAASRVASVDPARLLDADIGTALPTGPSAGELRRLGTEIEMWLHGAAANADRERRRLRRVTALWLWGGGTAEIAPATNTALREGCTFYGGDAFLWALRGDHGDSAPESFAALKTHQDRCVVEFTPMSGPKAESLAALDIHWFAPVRLALSQGDISTVDLIANDRRFCIRARPAWRVWRRRKSWLEQLARPAAGAAR